MEQKTNRADRRRWIRKRLKRGGAGKTHLQTNLENNKNLLKFDAAGVILGWLTYLRNKYNTPGNRVIAGSNNF